MFCPDCGEKNSETQNFCRSCGLGLEEISNALTVQRPRGGDMVKVERSVLDKAGEVGMIGLGGVGLIGIGYLIYKIAVTFILTGIFPIVGSLGIAGIIFAILTLVWVVRRQFAEDARKQRRLTPNTQIELKPHETGQLPNGVHQPASITEGTTRNLSR